MDISDGLARHLLDAAPDPSIVVDVDGCIQYANGRVSDVLGYEPSELIGQHIEVLLPERFHATHPSHRTKIFQQSQSPTYGVKA